MVVTETIFVIINATTKKFNNAIKQTNNYLRHFRMEMLGVMFFGQMLSRTMQNLLQPAMEAFGIFEIWGTMLQVLFLPIIAALFPYFMWLVEQFLAMPEPIKLIVGALVLFLLVLGIVLSWIGMIVLGLSSLAMAGGALGVIMTGLGIVFAVLIGAFLIIKGVIDVIKGKWEGLGLIIMGIGVILLLFIGWWALIPIAVGAAIYWIIKHWTEVKEFFIKTWTVIHDTFADIWNGIVDMIVWGVNKAISLINWLIRQINKIPGVNIGEIGQFNMDNVKMEHYKPKVDETIGTDKFGNPVSITQNNYTTASNKAEIDRCIADNNKKLVDDLTRRVGA